MGRDLRATIGGWVVVAALVSTPGSTLAQQGARDALPPAGFGSLRQDDVAVKLQNLGLAIKAIPLDESVIRLLAPDSYRAMRAQRESRAKELAAIAARMGLPSVQVWLVTYYTLEQGEARYDATDLVLRDASRDSRPLEVLPLTPAFSNGRVAQRVQQQALYLFDPSIDLTQPLTLLAAGQQSTGWTDGLQRLDSERAAVWSRAGAASQKKP
jgi:hypothetical protein